MNTGDERAALQAYSAAYRDWAQSWTALREVIAAAEPEPERLLSDLLNVMSVEFASSREVIRTAIVYANLCPAGGPDLDGLVGVAFVAALVAVVREQLQGSLARDLADLESRHEQWLAEAALWEPTSSEPFVPARPTMPKSVLRVQMAARDLATHQEGRAHESIAEGLAEAGREQGLDVREETTVHADGSVVRSTTILFGREGLDETDQLPDPEVPMMEPGGVWPRAGFFAHWAEGWRGSWRVMLRNELSEVLGDELSSHRKGSEAFEAAHRARQNIDPDAVVDIMEWRSGGWLLRDILPALTAYDLDAETGAEVIFGYRAGSEVPGFGKDARLVESYPVALLLPFQMGWQIFAVSSDDPGRFESPKKMKEALYDTRMAAIVGARRLTGME